MGIAGCKVGIVSDQPLNKSTLSKTLEELGLVIALNTSPDRVTPEDIKNEMISAWIIDLADEDRWSDFLDDLLDLATAPLLFGEGEVPVFNSDGFKRWQRRFHKKVKEILSPTESINIPAIEIPEIPDLSVPFNSKASGAETSSPLKEDQPSERLTLPENLSGVWKKGAPAPYVWILGASLGGPGAVKRFLDALPEGLPVGFVYAQHIDNNFLPVLHQVLGRHSVFDMRQCAHRRKVGIGEVHIVPVNHQIQSSKSEGVLFLHNRPWQGLYSPNISHVMKEFAQCFGPDTGAIVFSGMGDDASDGAMAMKEAGAEVWVQTLSTCASASMPEAVLATGRSSFQGTPEELAAKLVQTIASRHGDAVRIDEHGDDVSVDDPIYPY
ncbi:chemotaxis protein CheB [Litoribrevibacter euphylliae]|uniref:protein-glutamate methylesterase n=1 Tax=Litoribrevibacter euphylliae TaxID=1834034 RepID=A0ABV7HH83_9GAMM